MGSSVSYDLISAAQVPMSLLAATGLDGVLWPKQATLVDNTVYDYIVVGGGSAGCVTARRLAEDKTDNVLLLEAGDDPPIAAMLAGLFFLLPGSFVDYNYTSTEDNYAARGQHSHTMITAGKMLGGSASLNHFLHTRGIKEDYDDWAKASNDSSWTYENVLPYFIKSERMVDDSINNKYGQLHGTTGPMGISRHLETDRVADYLKSFAEVGNPTVIDLNADRIGYSQAQCIIADKKRQTPAYSYIKFVKDYSNFHCAKNTRAVKIVFEDNTAVAVEAVHDGKTYTFKANKEIILSCGVYNTPQLLMLSGIGHQEHLKKLDIDVIKDLPVGDNMVDQVAVSLAHKVKPYLLPILNPVHLPVDLTRVPFPYITGAAASKKSQSYPDYHTYNVLLEHDTPLLTITCKIIVGLRDEIYDSWQEQVANRDTLFTFLVYLHPKSKGAVRLRSNDPFDDPLITTGYYTEDEDLQHMLECIKDFKTVGDSEYFKEIGAELVGLDIPECADKEKQSDDFWTCYILNHSTCSYHSTSTCAMGKVVDSKLKVIGMEKLRVVDASVMPMVPRGAPHAAVVMLAEKASDMIKSDN